VGTLKYKKKKVETAPSRFKEVMLEGKKSEGDLEKVRCSN